ncbi:hypothetical protein NP493_1180g00000 [Ridgeia piscesae]|uniref:Uncharacterized protein n=1 Tax=Ridgeia piscesae TaxID=27915 RepID=A0AAD9KEI2_RIDPI|nr:hypothetical protein NP493_1180g00000 [Ridgeia piscesae]
MTKIFAVYLQASGGLSQSSENAFECCREHLGRYGICLSYPYPDVDLVAFFSVGRLSSSCLCRFPAGVRCTHLSSPTLEARSALLEFALSRRLSRS